MKERLDSNVWRAWRGAASGRCVGGDGGETGAAARRGAGMTLGDAGLARGLLRPRLRFRSRPLAAASSSVFASRPRAPVVPCGRELCRPSPGESRVADGRGEGDECVVGMEYTPNWGCLWDGICMRLPALRASPAALPSCIGEETSARPC